MNVYSIYTDGACIDNGASNAKGAWAFVVEGGPEKSGPLENTTNNRAELQAIIEALIWAKEVGQQNVLIYSDSQLCINCAAGRWKRKANLDLWADYENAAKGLCVGFKWVRGHSGVPLNERADELCQMAVLAMQDEPDVVSILRDIAKHG